MLVGLADPYVAEALAATGFDWLLIDGGRAPNDVRQILGQLQPVAAYDVHTVVRPVQGDIALIKQILGIGAQAVLIPMVENAARMVAATHYSRTGSATVFEVNLFDDFFMQWRPVHNRSQPAMACLT